MPSLTINIRSLLLDSSTSAFPFCSIRGRKPFASSTSCGFPPLLRIYDSVVMRSRPSICSLTIIPVHRSSRGSPRSSLGRLIFEARSSSTATSSMQWSKPSRAIHLSTAAPPPSTETYVLPLPLSDLRHLTDSTSDISLLYRQPQIYNHQHRHTYEQSRDSARG